MKAEGIDTTNSKDPFSDFCIFVKTQTVENKVRLVVCKSLCPAPTEGLHTSLRGIS